MDYPILLPCNLFKLFIRVNANGMTYRLQYRQIVDGIGIIPGIVKGKMVELEILVHAVKLFIPEAEAGFRPP